MYRFDSDYLEGCLPEILQRLQETNFEQTVGYGMDEYCANAKKIIRKVCNAPMADIHFLVGGTQTNATVISYLLKSYQGVLCADNGHINVHETGAVEHGGHKTLILPGTNGKISAAQIEKAMLIHQADFCREHTVQPGLVYISYPTEVGTLYSKRELEELTVTCHKWGMPLFIDGARLGYGLASPESDVTIEDIATIADIFYIGGTKQGAMFGEAVVFKNARIADDFRYSMKQKGAMLAKGRLLGIQFETLFKDGLYFRAAKNAVDKALKIQAAFLGKGFKLLTDSKTNQQFPIIPNGIIEKLKKDFSFEIWSAIDKEHSAVRFCTSWATTDEAVEKLVEAIEQLTCPQEDN